jgi:hypothetical protein
MKNKNKFSSYADAFKRLEFIKGQEELNEATKYVLKQNSPKTESPLADPAADAPIAPPVDAPAPSEPSDMPSDVPTEPEVGAEEPSGETEPEEPSEPKRSDYMAEVQKYAGKLGQELRDLHDKMESDDIKYVLNMIISAVDLDKLEDDDIEEIGKKFEREEEEGGDMEEPVTEPEAPVEDPVADEELGEGEDITMDALEDFIYEPAPMDTDEIDLSKYADLEEYDFPESDMDESGNYDANSRSYTFNHEDDIDEVSYVGERNPELFDKGEYNYDPHEMDTNLHKKYHQLMDMGHSDEEAQSRTFYPKENGFTKTHYDNIDMTPPRPKIGSHGEEHMDEDVELDLDEIKREINNSINTTLGKYFK